VLFDNSECAVEALSEPIGWREAHRQLQQIAARRATLDAEEAKWLLIARRERVHVQLGYGSFIEYMERALGYRPRTTIDRLRVADALTGMPETCAALASGAITYSVVRELTRVADAATEREWLDLVAGKTVREVIQMTAGRARGSRPGDRPDPQLQRRPWTAELSPDTLATMMQLRRELDAELGERLDDNSFVAVMCERVRRAGGSQQTRPPYQIALTVCEQCHRTTQDAAGDLIEVGPEVLERARCDAEHLGRVDAAVPARVTTDIPLATRRLVFHRDHRRCTVPGCRSTHNLEIHHINPRDAGGDHALANLTLLCGAHHRARHEGRLAIHGTAPDRLQFEHADGRRYGEDFFAQARSALRELGFSAAVADAALERARGHVTTDVRLEDLLRACLRECPRPTA